MILNYPIWRIKRFAWDYYRDYDANRAALNNHIEPVDIPELLMDEEFVRMLGAVEVLRKPHQGRNLMEFDGDIANEFLGRLSQGATLTTVCSMDDMPSPQTIYKWINDNEKFEKSYAKARLTGADKDFEKIEQIAEEVHKGQIDPKAARVAVDILKWKIGRQHPKKYSEKVMAEISGPDGAPIQHHQTTEVVDSKDIAKRVALLLQKGARENDKPAE